jgi:hypothetical protein
MGCGKAPGDQMVMSGGLTGRMLTPGLNIVEDSKTAATWSERIGKLFYEVILETDRFVIRLVFHDIRYRKLSDSTATISAVTIPLK